MCKSTDSERFPTFYELADKFWTASHIFFSAPLVLILWSSSSPYRYKKKQERHIGGLHLSGSIL